MKIISIGSDRKIFKENSAVRIRQIKYGKFFEELYLIVFSTKNQKLENSKISENVWVYPTNSKSRLLYIWDAFRIGRIINKKLKNKDIQVVVTTQDPFESGIVGAMLKLFLNLPLYVQDHTDFMHKYFSQESILNKLRFIIGEFVLGYSDRVRVVSERVKDSISQFSNNIDVLPIKAEIKAESPQGVALGGFPKATPWGIKKPFLFTFLMVCRLEKEKNIETILQVIKIFKTKNLGLCIVGDGSQKAYLEQLAKDLGISEKVYFAGWEENLTPYYKIADVFISSSLYEGYGISTVEAAIFGKPLILSNTGLAGDVFKKYQSAFICDAKDIECFSKAIMDLYQNRGLVLKMGQVAKISAENHLQPNTDYFEEYANSVTKTLNKFKKRRFLSRIINLKLSAFRSVILLRYFICGITAAAVNIGFLYIFTDIVGIWYLYSSIWAFLIALILSFTLQKFVVFRDKSTVDLHHQFSKFFIVAVLGVTTNTVLIYVFVDVFGIWYIFSQIIAGFFVMIQNFLLYKFFIFNRG